ncbi:MAG: aldehyde dehydrogenase family protein, partial [Thermoguttaceae bacterium]
MPEHFPLLVPDAKPAAALAEVRAPFDGSLIATVEQADGAAVEKAFETAYSLFRSRDAWLKPSERIAVLEKAAALMQAN